MITAAQNELLTRVGRATAMGKFMRQFWVPACLSSELEASALRSQLPDFPTGVRALDDLLVRVRLNGIHALR